MLHISMCLLQKCCVNIPETTSTSTDLLLHAYQLRQIGTRFLQAQFIAPFFDLFAGVFNAFYTPKTAGYAQHLVDVLLDAFDNSLADLLVGYFLLVFRVI